MAERASTRQPVDETTRSAGELTQAGHEPALLFEVAWEVCTQVGGIYTVLRSKAPATVRRWGDQYCLVGPYREASARIELELQTPTGPIGAAVAVAEHAGIQWHFGRWLVTGRPQVLLVDLGSVAGKLGEAKYGLWKNNGIGSPTGDWDFDESALFGYAVAELLHSLKDLVGPWPVLAHFHEWQAAAALPMLRHRNVPIATVFTTHATLVGRALCSANAQIYEHLGEIDAGAVAFRHGFGHRHALEGAAAQAASIFTTVSAITALEAEYFLGRRPEVLLPNGLNIERFAAPHRFQELHNRAKRGIHEFTTGHFFPSYHFDLDQTLYVFTAGRYEYRNKGLDVFIDALVELNRRMRAMNSTQTVVAFIITRAPYKAMNVETLSRRAMLDELRDTCEAVSGEMGQRLFQSITAGHMPTLDDLLDEYAGVRLKRIMHAVQRTLQPPIVTHDLLDDGGDAVLNHLRARGLWNHKDDRVKVVFHPEFITTTSPLLGMEYDDFVRGCHMGVFPSYYEPWGYTPMECVVRGVPAVTSDFSGFGNYVTEHFPNHDADGMFVARRRGTSFEYCVAQVADWLHDLTRMNRRDRIALRNRVESHAGHFDWNNLGQYYVTAQRQALAKVHPGVDAIPVDPEYDPPVPDGTAPVLKTEDARRGRGRRTRRGG